MDILIQNKRNKEEEEVGTEIVPVIVITEILIENGTGNGIYATKVIEKDEIVLYIPCDIMLGQTIYTTSTSTDNYHDCDHVAAILDSWLLATDDNNEDDDEDHHIPITISLQIVSIIILLSYENGFNPLNGYSPEWMDIPLNGFPLYDYDTVKW